MNKIVVLCVILFFLSSTVCPAEQEQEDANMARMDDIVVTATKTKEAISNAPGSIYVVSRQDLEKRNIKTIDDAFAIIPGAFVKRTKGLMDSTSSVRLRGFNNDRYTLILIDGQPVNDAYTGGVEWGMLPIESVEKIEVVKGPASALYGGNAMGGVINIITRTPEKTHGLIKAGMGNNGTHRYSASCGTRFKEKLSLRLGYEAESTDGYPTTPVLSTISSGAGNVSGGYAMKDNTNTKDKWVVGDKGDNNAKKETISGKAVYDFTDTGKLSFSLVSGEHEYDYGPPNTYMGTSGDNTTYADAGSGLRARFRPYNFIYYTGIGDNQTDIMSLGYEDIYQSVHVSLKAGFHDVEDRYTTQSGSGMSNYYDSAGTLNETENKSLFFEAQGDLPIGDSHHFTMGISYKTGESDTNEHNIPYYRSYSGRSASTYHMGGKSWTCSMYAQDEWSLDEKITLYLGTRYDYWEVSDGLSGNTGSETNYADNNESSLSPKLSVVWKPLSDTVVRGSMGQAFRAPTLYELYRTWTSGSTTYQSNPYLKPETVSTVEAGIDQSFYHNRIKFGLTGFWNEIDDLIYYKMAGSTKTRTNAGKAKTLGLELESSWAMSDHFTLWGNYTYTNAEIRENATDPDSEGKQVTGIPENTFNLGLDFKADCYKANLTGRYISKIYNNSDNSDVAEGVYSTYEPAFYLDAKVTWSPFKRWDISLSVNNILDKEHYQYYKEEGRSYFAEVAFKF
ncbi:TonB-dependent receptor [Desulfobacula phenolica]|uniref:Iron complex outermembrane recepter protein n=1 Tax=Desulfobacula phenolica TaxID=90732 RepID=A0A1H2ICW4_9BACT|nr:TonB-dependent receptor [Desulfobacula phenolica]SDU41841.1 iron complex outermembrane recepter protein [Desulfobacula phenolica]